jgi:hypothetical protein
VLMPSSPSPAARTGCGVLSPGKLIPRTGSAGKAVRTAYRRPSCHASPSALFRLPRFRHRSTSRRNVSPLS